MFSRGWEIIEDTELVSIQRWRSINQQIHGWYWKLKLFDGVEKLNTIWRRWRLAIISAGNIRGAIPYRQNSRRFQTADSLLVGRADCSPKIHRWKWMRRRAFIIDEENVRRHSQEKIQNAWERRDGKKMNAHCRRENVRENKAFTTDIYACITSWQKFRPVTVLHESWWSCRSDNNTGTSDRS